MSTHWTTDEKDARNAMKDMGRTFYQCPNGHESSTVNGVLVRCPIAYCNRPVKALMVRGRKPK